MPLPLSTNTDLARNASKRIDWAGLGWLYLFFWFFSGVMQTILLPTVGFPIRGFGSAFFMSFLWLAPVLLFPRWTRKISAIIGVVLWATSLISLGYWWIYGQEFSSSIIFTIFETNLDESREYFSQYVSYSLLLVAAVYTLVACLLWKRLRPVYLPNFRAAGAFCFLIVAILGEPYIPYISGEANFAQATSALQKRMEPAAPWQLVMGYFHYRKQLNVVQALLHKNATLPPLQGLKDSNGDTPRTLVLVIGESTTSQRMSLYGYPRQTTPRLDALKTQGNLLAFNDVITSRPYTIEILQQSLSFANQQEPDRFLTEPNLMNLMKQAGYKTFWITNQQTITKRNTLLTTFSQQADETRYLNHQRVQNATPFDQIVLAPFAETLMDTAPKKFIVVHLLGAHSQYSYRYPKEYEKFTARDNVPAPLTDSQVALYNSYDNAVLYNDFVVSSLIETFAKSQSNGFVLYFSDHGEEVFHKPPHQTLGRNENAPTLDMYAIPFMLWMSPEWKKTHPSSFDDSILNRSYSNAHFIHTWSDLAGLRYELFQPELSLVNSDFKKQTRWIGDPKIKKNLRDFDGAGVRD